MKGPLAVIGAGLSGATGGLTAALLAAAAVIALVAVRGARRRRRCTPDEAGPEQGRDRPPSPEAS